VNGFSVARCVACYLIFLDPQPSTEELERQYQGYHTGNGSCSVGEGQWFLASSGERQLFEEILRIAQRLRPGGRLLDVGCSYGTLVESAVNIGYDAYGIEPFDEPFTYARDRLGHRIRQGTLEDVCASAETWDIVTLANVLEHLPSPLGAVRGIHRVLRPGGLLFVVIPNVLPFLGLMRLAGRRAGGRLTSRLAVFDTPFHLYFFTPKTLRDLCLRSGFSVVLERNAAIIRNRSWVKTGAKQAFRTAAELLRVASGGRLLIGHSILMVAEKRPLEGTGG
jgi:2-polyprenyl-3-methyl-5-hydroxy-6-metoxy-1,4-benzoquinol methylase